MATQNLTTHQDHVNRQDDATAIEDARATLEGLSDKLDALTDRLPALPADTVDAKTVYRRGRLETAHEAIKSAAGILRDQVQNFCDEARSVSYPGRHIRNHGAWAAAREFELRCLSLTRDDVFSTLASLEELANLLCHLASFAEADTWPPEQAAS